MASDTFTCCHTETEWGDHHGVWHIYVLPHRDRVGRPPWCLTHLRAATQRQSGETIMASDTFTCCHTETEWGDHHGVWHIYVLPHRDRVGRTPWCLTHLRAATQRQSGETIMVSDTFTCCHTETEWGDHHGVWHIYVLPHRDRVERPPWRLTHLRAATQRQSGNTIMASDTFTCCHTETEWGHHHGVWHIYVLPHRDRVGTPPWRLTHLRAATQRQSGETTMASDTFTCCHTETEWEHHHGVWHIHVLPHRDRVGTPPWRLTHLRAATQRQSGETTMASDTFTCCHIETEWEHHHGVWHIYVLPHRDRVGRTPWCLTHLRAATQRQSGETTMASDTFTCCHTETEWGDHHGVWHIYVLPHRDRVGRPPWRLTHLRAATQRQSGNTIMASDTFTCCHTETEWGDHHGVWHIYVLPHRDRVGRPPWRLTHLRAATQRQSGDTIIASDTFTCCHTETEWGDHHGVWHIYVLPHRDRVGRPPWRLTHLRAATQRQGGETIMASDTFTCCHTETEWGDHHGVWHIYVLPHRDRVGRTPWCLTHLRAATQRQSGETTMVSDTFTCCHTETEWGDHHGVWHIYVLPHRDRVGTPSWRLTQSSSTTVPRRFTLIVTTTVPFSTALGALQQCITLVWWQDFRQFFGRIPISQIKWDEEIHIERPFRDSKST